MRKTIVIGGVLVLFLLIGAGVLRSRIQELEHVAVTDDVWMISGMGGNVGVLRTGEGTVIVDTMTFTLQGNAIRKLAEELTGEPVSMIINTHYHLDHTHGNPAFEPGTRVVSTARTLEHLEKRDAWYWKDQAAHLLPNETFDTDQTLELGNKTIRLLHPGRGHTDGDLVALFVEDRVVHTGDLFFNRRYPNIDLEAGGSVQQWGNTLDRVFPLAFDQVIPGHGPVASRRGLRQFQRFIRQLAEAGVEAAAKGRSLEEMIRHADLSEDEGYENMEIPLILGLNREFVLRRSWEEATGAVKPE